MFALVIVSFKLTRARWPSEERAIPVGAPTWGSTARQLPVVRSHTRAVPSSDAVTSVTLSALMAAEETLSLCPDKSADKGEPLQVSEIPYQFRLRPVPSCTLYESMCRYYCIKLASCKFIHEGWCYAPDKQKTDEPSSRSHTRAV